MRDRVPASTQALEVSLQCCTAGVYWAGAGVEEGEDGLTARAKVERRFTTDLDGLADGVTTLELLA